MNIDKTLEERQKTHGDFSTHAYISQILKNGLHNGNWHDLDFDQKESLEMIVHKIARILNGNPNIHDHWHDIVGYAKLVADRLDASS